MTHNFKVSNDDFDLTMILSTLDVFQDRFVRCILIVNLGVIALYFFTCHCLLFKLEGCISC